jgi:pSer/pThr/pTyr-binding forkhead associated (FHA) protein
MMLNPENNAGDKTKLVFTFGLRQGEQFQISKMSTVIGRDPSADIQLDSPYVSRQHAKIEGQGGYWFLTDLYSKNGVYRNTRRIQPGKPVRLNHRDQVQIGSVSSFRFHDPERTVRQSEVRLLAPGLHLDPPNRDVYIHGERLDPPLSPQQFTLLKALAENEGTVFTNEEIAEALWPEAAGGVENAAIDNAISRLRDRLVELDDAHDYIETVRGVGRRFVQREI